MSLLSRLAVRAARAYGMLAAGSATNVSADYLVVAGGGGGAGGYGAADAASGAGGAGGLLSSTFTLSTLNTYTITVGAGGNGGATNTNGVQGSNSVVSGTGLTTVTSTGGGYGGAIEISGGNGGSGGGAGAGGGAGVGGTGTVGQGNNGGGKSGNSGGGGGGAGSVGGTASGTTGGSGGTGSSSSISGTSVTYASGGGGGGKSVGGSVSAGGGGAGGAGAGNGTAGTANLGGGGGGGGGISPSSSGTGGAGGSGIVIISYTSATPKFVGGTITTSGGKQIHTFTSSGTLSPITPITASYLVVAGGGSGGGGSAAGDDGGGGGAGGLLTSSTTLYTGASYIVTVGAGGSPVASGSNSVISGTGLTTITSTGGGSGATGNGNAANGGSGGGAGGSGSIGTGTSGQGNNGGTGSGSSRWAGGGGGGASAVGGNAGPDSSGSNGGAGGAGTASSISGSSVTYAGGGGGHSYNGTAGAGGSGGGGAGGKRTGPVAGTSGTTNTGGGGGGGPANSTAGSGGSGIVIISYAGSQAFNGGLVTTSGGNTIHTFTSTGALTPLTNNLNNSLRFRRSNSAYLSRTPNIASNRKTWTWSAWIKRGQIGAAQVLFSAGGGASPYTAIYFQAADDLVVEYYSAPTNYYIITSQLFRDPSAWYHIVVVWDTTQATSSNRIKIYVNGNQVTSFSTAIYPAQNTDGFINNNTNTAIGSWATVASTFDGYMTDINFIDGQALEPYYFGNNDANLVWKPIQYKGTYGTNGFYLTFGNTTSTTTLGYDSSPNGNNWTCNNISLTTGTTYDAMTDVPTNTSATVANYAVMNPLWKDGTTVIAQGNLDVSNGNYGGFSTLTIPTNSKFYAEFTVTATQGNQGVGILKAANAYSGVISQADMFGSNSVTYYSTNGNKFVLGGGSTAYGSSWGTIGDVIGIAVNTVDNQITFYKNNTSQGVITGLTSGIEWVFATGNQTNTGGGAWNFGQRPFTYTPPTGYVALNTYNLPTPTILQGNKYMDATLYTGTGTTQNIVNAAGFKPDLVWTKVRNQAYGHALFDSVRGVGNALQSNNTNAEDAWGSSTLASFNSNGFTAGADTSYLVVNSSGNTFVGWQWQAGQGTTSTNTNGTITSTVSVNTTAGFSIVTWTGTGSPGTVGHGLGVAPKMVISKKRNSISDWAFWITGFAGTELMEMNSTSGKFTGTTVWNSTTPTSTVFSVGSATQTNNSGGTYVAYLWSEIAGFSKFGSYTGNGSADGPFVYTGFRPKWIMIKRTDTTADWQIIDTPRQLYNDGAVANQLRPNSSVAEASAGTYSIDILSNGFKDRTGASTNWNTNGGTYIYAAFAENPFKNSNAR